VASKARMNEEPGFNSDINIGKTRVAQQCKADFVFKKILAVERPVLSLAHTVTLRLVFRISTATQ